MEELYWITRLSAIHITVFIIMIVSLIGFIISVLYFIINHSEFLCCDEYYKDQYAKLEKFKKKLCIYFFIPLFISSILFTLIPTTKEGLLIYGVGGTIDYLKENPTAKKLPDKCINALDKWVCSLQTDSVKVK